jgi:hypothetical protein
MEFTENRIPAVEDPKLEDLQTMMAAIREYGVYR